VLLDVFILEVLGNNLTVLLYDKPVSPGPFPMMELKKKLCSIAGESEE
jgi:hypothetical protein